MSEDEGRDVAPGGPERPSQPGWGEPTQPPYGQQPPPPYWSQQQPPPYGQQPTQPPYGQQPAPPYWSQQQPPAAPGPAGPGWGAAGWGAPRPPEVKPGIVPLRPLGVGEILDGAIACMRTHWRPMLGFSFAVVAVLQTLQGILTYVLLNNTALQRLDGTTPVSESDVIGLLGTGFTLFLAVSVLSLLAQVLLTGVLTVVVSQAVLGRPVSVRTAWEQVKPRLWALIGLSLLFGLAVIAGTLLCIVPGIIVYVYFSLSSSVLVLERSGVTASMGRSRQLVQTAWWRTFGILLLAFLVQGLVAQVLTFPFTLIAGGGSFFFGQGGELTFPAAVLTTIGAIVAGTITEPFRAAVGVLIYVDRRIRREALDIELARAAGVALPGQSATPGAVPPPPTAPPTGW